MDKAEVLRSIYNQQLVYIQQKVRVDFDNVSQQPVGFALAGEWHAIEDIVCSFKMLPNQQVNGYLVKDANRDVFLLYSQLMKVSRRNSLEPGFWVLSFRIQNDDELMSWYREDRKMLANITLKQVVNFHGHICPELAVGGKFCEFVQNLFNQGTLPTTSFAVLAENTTSALDAIQVLLGATVGNQRLLVMDYGKHNYTVFSKSKNQGWKLRLKAFQFGDEEVYHDLEHKIASSQAMIDEVIYFQQLIDARVKWIMASTPDELFFVEESVPVTPPGETAIVYVQCAVCGEQVLASRSIDRRDMTLCIPCFQKMSPGCSHYQIQ